MSLNLENMKLELANNLVHYMKNNKITIEELAAELEMTPEVFEERFNEINYSFYSLAFSCCEKLAASKKLERVLQNEYK